MTVRRPAFEKLKLLTLPSVHVLETTTVECPDVIYNTGPTGTELQM